MVQQHLPLATFAAVTFSQRWQLGLVPSEQKSQRHSRASEIQLIVVIIIIETIINNPDDDYDDDDDDDDGDGGDDDDDDDKNAFKRIRALEGKSFL